MKAGKSDITLIQGMLFSILSQGADTQVFKLSFATMGIVLLISGVIEAFKEEKNKKHE